MMDHQWGSHLPGSKDVAKKLRKRRGDLDLDPGWACPFFRHDWKGHQECRHVQMKRISDVRQHLNRSHSLSEGTADKLKNSKNKRSPTSEDRWFSIWEILFPEVGLAVPNPSLYRYAGTAFAELSALSVRDYINHRGPLPEQCAWLLHDYAAYAASGPAYETPDPEEMKHNSPFSGLDVGGNSKRPSTDSVGH